MAYEVYIEDLEEFVVDIEGFEGYYKITSKGRVISLGGKSNHKKSIVLSQNTDRDGYKVVCLQRDKVRLDQKVHRLVAETFVPKEEGKDIVNHKDSDRGNNSRDNLEWVDEYGNYIHSPKNKKEIQVAAICRESGQEFIYKSLMEAGRDLGINQGNITNCLKGRCKSVGGFYWRIL